MLNKYFEYITVFIFCAVVLGPMIWLRLRMRLRYLQKLACLNMLRRQQKNDHIVLYSTEIIQACCQILYFSRTADSAKALRYLLIGKTTYAVTFLLSKNPMLALLLKAHKNAVPVYHQLLRKRKKHLKEKPYGVYLPLLAYLCHDLKNFSLLMPMISENCYKSTPYYHYTSAYAYLSEGDMLSASQSASTAQKLFASKHYFFEEALCCLALAEIYKISCIEDVSQTMIDAAIRIFKRHHLVRYIAKATAMRGMLMVFENRYEEALQCYEQALEVAPSDLIKADIYNQLALLYIAQNQIADATKKLALTAGLLQHAQNSHSFALCRQLQGQVAYNLKEYKTAEKYLQESLLLYQKQQNHSAVAECLYLLAGSKYASNDFATSEQYLRKILDICHLHKNNFHQANAYSLLGLIYLQTHDFQRAKVLFQQSLRLEQHHERCEGLTSDYVNLALIEQIFGNTDSARKNLQTAFDFATKSGDKTLCTLVEQKLKKLT